MLMTTLKHIQVLVLVTVLTSLSMLVCAMAYDNYYKVKQDRYLNKLRYDKINVYLSTKK